MKGKYLKILVMCYLSVVTEVYDLNFASKSERGYSAQASKNTIIIFSHIISSYKYQNKILTYYKLHNTR